MEQMTGPATDHRDGHGNGGGRDHGASTDFARGWRVGQGYDREREDGRKALPELANVGRRPRGRLKGVELPIRAAR